MPAAISNLSSLGMASAMLSTALPRLGALLKGTAPPVPSISNSRATTNDTSLQFYVPTDTVKTQTQHIMAHSAVWNSHPKNYGKGSRGW